MVHGVQALSEVIASIPHQGIAVADRTGRITVWNSAAEVLTGQAEAEALGADLVWLHRGDDGSELTLEAAAQEPVSWAGWRMRKDGGRFWCEATLFGVRDAGGKLVGFAEAFVDATAGHDRLAALEEHDAVFSAVLRGGSIIVSSQDRDLRITWVHTAPAELGYTSTDSIVGKTDEELIPPEAAAVSMAAKRAVIASGKGRRFDLPIETAEGPRTYDLTVEPLLDPSGRVVGLTTISLDVTDQRIAERLLARSRARLAEAEQVARMGSWEWDLVTHEIHWSDGLFAIYGVQPGEFSGRYEARPDRVHPDERARVDAVVNHSMATGAPFDLTYRIIRPDGRVRMVNSRGEAVFGEDGRPLRFSGIVQDLTDAREAEATLQETAAELARRAEELQRLAGEANQRRVKPAQLLGKRQLEVLGLVAEGYSNGEIASRLYLSENTVKWHVGQILRKLGAANRAQAIARYLGSERGPGA